MAKKPFDPFAEKRRPGAPTTYTPELAEELCSRLRQGRDLWTICNDDDDMPGRSTVYQWMDAHPEFADMYLRAKEYSALSDAEKAERITYLTSQGKIDANAARVAIDAIKWTTAHKQPKRFGRVTTQRHTGEDGGAIPLRFESLSDAQLSNFIDRLADFAARAGSAGGGEGGAGPEAEGEDL
jgi:hypothetical protein